MKKILIVDDDLDVREMFCEAVNEVLPGVACYKATNGRRALMAMDNEEISFPDLIFLDINMPMMNGWQCLSRLKATEKYKDIPVIIYTTSSFPEDVEKARELGAFCFFTKPSRYLDLKKSLILIAEYVEKRDAQSLVRTSDLFA